MFNFLSLLKPVGAAIAKYGFPTVAALALGWALYGFNKQVTDERAEIRVEQRDERKMFIEAIDRNTSAIQELTVAVTRLEQGHDK